MKRTTFLPLLLLSFTAVPAQTQVKPGFNLFSVEQDQEMGKQSALEVEQQLPILNDRTVESYVSAIGKRLAAVAPGADYAYQFKVVNVSDINAFALPGGYMYVNRGLIEAARSEGELAGVMAHEMAHVALRHGTNQASKSYLGQTGLGILGGLLGKDNETTRKRLATVGGFGLGALSLKFSRTDEEQADVVGAQMMAKAGYDPADMTSFFQLLADKSSREPSKVEQFFSSHPAPANRASRISRERSMLTVNATRPVGNFKSVRSKLTGMRAAPSMAQVAKAATAAQPASSTQSTRTVPEVAIARPAADLRTFDHRSGLYRISYPSNWRVYPADSGYGVTIAPEGGFVDTGGAERDLVNGVILNHYDPFGDDSADDRFGESRVGNSSDRPTLVNATNDLVQQIRRSNPNLIPIQGSERRDTIDGEPSFSVVLSGKSNVTRQEERVTVFTRELHDEHVLYALFIAPGADYPELRDTFNRMISSLRIDDSASHRSSDGTRTDPSTTGYRVEPASDGYARFTLPSGTVMPIMLDQTLTTAAAQIGDRFSARVAEPVMISGRVAIPAGSVLSGHVLDVVPAKRIGGRAQMNLQFDTIRVGSSGSSVPISASFHDEAKNETSRDSAAIGGGAAAGALIGRIFGKDTKATVIGALVGGAIGTGVAALTVGQELVIPEGTVLQIELVSPLQAG